MFVYNIPMDDFIDEDGLIHVGLGGDNHGDNPSSDVHSFREFLAEDIAKILMGDLREGILPKDKRFSIREHTQTSIESFGRLEREIKRAKGTILGLLKGNHEETLFKEIGNYYWYPITDEETGRETGEYGGMCEDLGIRYLGTISMLRLTTHGGKYVTTWQVSHPNRGSISYRTGEPKRIEVNKEIKAKTLQSHVSKADAYFCGHYHQLIVNKPDYKRKLVYDAKKKRMIMKRVLVDPAWYCVTGSFLKTYDEGRDGNYAEQAMYEPTDIGWLEVIMDAKLNILEIKKRYSHGDPDAL